MLFEPLFERFACGTPLSVMTRALLENALQPDPLDELFERLAVKQYTRELLFSTVVETMALVACRIYKSPRAVYTEHPDWFPVTLKCVYEKLQGIEPPVMREMVRDHARRSQGIIEELGGQVPALLPGYRVKILDGNSLAGTDHRLKELRQTTAAALPGKSLVVLDPALGLALDVIPCEDGHAQERSLFADVLQTSSRGTCGSKTATSAPWASSVACPSGRASCWCVSTRACRGRPKASCVLWGGRGRGRCPSRRWKSPTREVKASVYGGSSSGWTSRRGTGRWKWSC